MPLLCQQPLFHPRTEAISGSNWSQLTLKWPQFLGGRRAGEKIRTGRPSCQGAWRTVNELRCTFSIKRARDPHIPTALASFDVLEQRLVAGNTGLRTIDVGVPSLSMHSIRETCGVEDIANSFDLFLAFYRDFSALDANCDFEAICQPCL